VLKECEATRDKIQSEDLLSEESRGLKIMRKIERESRKKQEKEEKNKCKEAQKKEFKLKRNRRKFKTEIYRVM